MPKPLTPCSVCHRHVTFHDHVALVLYGVEPYNPEKLVDVGPSVCARCVVAIEDMIASYKAKFNGQAQVS